MAGYIGNKAVGINVTTGDILGDVGVGGDIDVDGTANLDVVDIDGAVNMATTALVTGVLTTTAATVFNGGFASNASSTVSAGSNGSFGVTGSNNVFLNVIGASANEKHVDFYSGSTKQFEIFLDGNENLTFRKQSGNLQRMKIDSTGAVTKPAQPAFLAQPASTQQPIAINSNVTVIFGTERFDVNADFASNVFTAPVAGKYQFNVNVFFKDLDEDANYMELQLATTNRGYSTSVDPDVGTDPVRTTMQVVTLADLDAGDTAFVRAIQSEGAAQADIAVESFFSGYLVA